MVDVENVEYVEAVVTMRTGAPAGPVEAWLERHGLSCLPMRVGLLARGDRPTFDAAFGASLTAEALPTTLPVPAELQEAVAEITIPAPRRYYGSDAAAGGALE